MRGAGADHDKARRIDALAAREVEQEPRQRRTAPAERRSRRVSAGGGLYRKPARRGRKRNAAAG